ncbi:MATE family efflux transporter [Marinibacterium anthonyi]|nr:MATE family efflux transporter [Marinibacterium anthonyi]
MSHATRFLTAPVGALLTRTAAPIILVMVLSGSLNLVDVLFLGRVAGPGAVAAVSAIFPLTAACIAMSAMVGSGMASLLARRLGAGATDDARALFASAHGLALTLGLALIAGVALAGPALTLAAADGDPAVAAMAHRYLSITIGAAPVMFWLGLQVDALRSEGRAPLMAGLGVLVTLANIAFNYVLIVRLDMGVAGSAWGTVAAQALALGLGLLARGRMDTPLPLAAIVAHRWWGGWPRILALGAPLSLSFLGIALVASVILMALQQTAGPDYVPKVAAYGLITRLIGFAFLPLMGLAQAMQAVVGNNLGAGLTARSDRALALTLLAALVYCCTVQAGFMIFAPRIGAVFVDDPAIARDLAAILRPMVLLYALSGPTLVLALYFQSVGQPGRAALLTLSKPYVLQPPLILGLAALLGDRGIWFASPISEAVLALVALVIWSRVRRPGQAGFGLAGGAGA